MAHRRKLTPGSSNPYGEPALYFWEITWKQAGNAAFKTALPPSSTVGLSRKPLTEIASLSFHLLQYHQAEVTPTSSREAVQCTSLTPNHQSLRDCSVTPFPWCIHKIVHSAKTVKIIDDATLLLMSFTRKWCFVLFFKKSYDVISEISPEFGWIVGHDQHQAVDL